MESQKDTIILFRIECARKGLPAREICILYCKDEAISCSFLGLSFSHWISLMRWKCNQFSMLQNFLKLGAVVVMNWVWEWNGTNERLPGIPPIRKESLSVVTDARGIEES